jgi:uncharacterized protein (DUF58 family)
MSKTVSRWGELLVAFSMLIASPSVYKNTPIWFFVIYMIIVLLVVLLGIIRFRKVRRFQK